jgi:hypothetical protein
MLTITAAAMTAAGTAPLRVQIVSAIADSRAEPRTPSMPDRVLGDARAGAVEVRKFRIRVISAMFDRSASESHA